MARKTTEFEPKIHLFFKGYAASFFALAISSRDPALAIAHHRSPFFFDGKGDLPSAATQNCP